MAETQKGQAHIYGLTGVALTGYATINLQNARASHKEDNREIKGQDGRFNSLILNNEVLDLVIEFIPEAATKAAVAAVAGLPARGTKVTLSGFGTIGIGSFANALNGDFIYMGDGQITGPNDREWTATLPLRKYEQDLTATVT